MIVENVKNVVHASGVMEVARATIKASPKLFNFFADQTYANKPLAIARELVANGIDSHGEAGCPHRSVEVTLPCELDPVFKVRDFGVGMSHEFMMTRYMAYTDSTKDSSNDAIGGFGIGRWSPFAYTSQFTVRSVHNGQLGVYTAYKGEDGVPEIGCLGRSPTTEPNGVEVSFPVEVDDIATFLEAAQQALQYFKPLPVVINGEIDAPEFAYEGNGWAIRGEAGPLGVILGGVRYPVSTANLDWSLRSSTRLSPLLEYGLDLWMPIGACGVALSREQLSYDGKTSANIEAKLEELIDDVIATFSTMFDNQPSLWDAMVALSKEVGQNEYGSNARQKLLRANARYHGSELKTELSLRNTGIVGTIWHIESENARRSSKSLKTMSWTPIVDFGVLQPGNISHVIIDNMPDTPKSKVGARVRDYVEENGRPKSVIVLRAGERENMAKIRVMLLQLGNPSNVVYTADMPEPTTVKTTKSGATRPRVRMFTFNGKNDRFTHSTINNLQPGYAKQEAVFEVEYKDQPATGIAVVMENFALPADFYQRMATKLIRYDELHFVNGGDWPKLKDAWQNFDDVFAARLKAALAAYPELSQRIALYRNTELRPFWDFAKQLDYQTLTPAQAKRPFGKIVELWREFIKPLTIDQHNLAPFVTAALPARIEPAKLVASFKQDQADVQILLDVLELDDSKHVALLLKNL